MILKNDDIIKQNGQLLGEMLKKAGLSQRICALNMGQYANYLTNYIYKYEGKTFPRSFSYLFLSSVYHSLKRDDQNKNRNTKFVSILNEVMKDKLNVYHKLLMPALEHHILGITKINKNVFNKGQEEIIENYINEIYDKEKINEYKSFLNEMEFERVGYQNLLNLKGSLNELQKKEYRFSKEELKRYLRNLDFEKQTKSIQDFYFLCETLRRSLIPNFYSPADFKEITLENSDLGGFLIKRSVVNKLENSNKALGGQFIWKSGHFSFEPEKLKKIELTPEENDYEIPQYLQADDINTTFSKKDLTLTDIDRLVARYGLTKKIKQLLSAIPDNHPIHKERIARNVEREKNHLDWLTYTEEGIYDSELDKKKPEGHFYFGKWVPGKKPEKSPSLFEDDDPLDLNDLKKSA